MFRIKCAVGIGQRFKDGGRGKIPLPFKSVLHEPEAGRCSQLLELISVSNS